jgi:hypothetical protein
MAVRAGGYGLPLRLLRFFQIRPKDSGRHAKHCRIVATMEHIRVDEQQALERGGRAAAIATIFLLLVATTLAGCTTGDDAYVWPSTAETEDISSVFRSLKNDDPASDPTSVERSGGFSAHFR